MNDPAFEQLISEHRVLVASHGRAQARCSEIIARQASEIQALRDEVMRLRAEVIRRDTQIAILREDHAELQRTIPGLPTRLSLARKVGTLMERIQELLRERSFRRVTPDEAPVPDFARATTASHLDNRSVLCLSRDVTAARTMIRLVEMAGGRCAHDPVDETEDLARIEQSVRAADLVICQAGCISQDAYWRVRDHCRRTGKPCLLVERPEAIAPVQR